MESVTKENFVESVLKAHMACVEDAWKAWIEAREAVHKGGPTGRKDRYQKFMLKYPAGFKDFLTEFIQKLIDDNNAQKTGAKA